MVRKNVEKPRPKLAAPRKDAKVKIKKDMGVRPTQLTIKQPAFQKFRPDYDLFQNLQHLHEC